MVVLITKFTHGAWITILAMDVIFLMMKGIRRHYQTHQLHIVYADESLVLPSRVHAIVLVSKLHRPTLRALAFAKAARPSTLEAVTVDVDPEESEELQAEWVPPQHPSALLKRPDLAKMEITRPILHVRDIRHQSPRDVVMVYIPEYVVGHWWENLLHNQSALRLKGRLLFTAVMGPGAGLPRSGLAAGERQDRDELVRRGDTSDRRRQRERMRGAAS